MKQIPNFSRYLASEDGDLYSVNYKRTGKTVKLKPAKSPDGYLKTVFLGDDGKYKPVCVHRMIALAYFGESNGLQVNHKNGIKTDNRLENLEYCTISENIIHAYKMNLIIPKRGELNGMSKLTEQDVIEIREHAANFKGRYYGRKMLAEKYGVSEAHIKDIVTKRRNVWPSV
jgi:hypothetical protein